MTEERTGREVEPRRVSPSVGPRGTGREIAPREEREATVERFSAGESAHTIGLTEERASQIVRQSGNARNIAFLAVLLVALFVPLYWFYDLGIPAIAGTSRLEKEVQTQEVTDVSRGYALFLANCAQCHGTNGEGGVGPPLNDQNKLYNAVTTTGLPGTGHLNPNYIKNVLTVGGRYVCGDPNSVMPVWADVNGGPLNYRQIQELIAWLTASKDVSFQYQPEHPEPGQTLPPPVTVHGWRDPNYKPPAGQASPPACWRAPQGVLSGGGSGGASSPSPITNPGTASNPRTIQVNETADLQIQDPNGQKLGVIAVKKGETVKFEVTNKAGFDHNFYIGTQQDLQGNNTANLKGVPTFASGTKDFTMTFDQDAQLQFACIVPGHYQSMHGDVQIQQ